MIGGSMNAQDELEQLRRVEEYRNAQRSRGRLPEPLWKLAAELAGRYGLNQPHERCAWITTV
jgi:hypothetical protein